MIIEEDPLYKDFQQFINKNKNGNFNQNLAP